MSTLTHNDFFFISLYPVLRKIIFKLVRMILLNYDYDSRHEVRRRRRRTWMKDDFVLFFFLLLFRWPEGLFRLSTSMRMVLLCRCVCYYHIASCILRFDRPQTESVVRAPRPSVAINHRTRTMISATIYYAYVYLCCYTVIIASFRVLSPWTNE